jgi:hypothetical protein
VRRFPLIALLALLVLALAACGENNDKDKAALKAPCLKAAPLMKHNPSLPGKFPNAVGMHYTGVTKDGPATVAAGFINAGIGDAHKAFHDAVSGAPGYKITHEEQDVADSEVNFSGNGQSGQVKMNQTCRSRTEVRITIRPA